MWYHYLYTVNFGIVSMLSAGEVRVSIVKRSEEIESSIIALLLNTLKGI